MNNIEILQMYICEAERLYIRDCLHNGDKVNTEILNMFAQIIKEQGDKK